MAHFAEIDENNVVVRVVVVDNEKLMDENGNEVEELGVAHLKSVLGEQSNWVQTSYNGSFRKAYAGVGYLYDPIKDEFYLPVETVEAEV